MRTYGPGRSVRYPAGFVVVAEAVDGWLLSRLSTLLFFSTLRFVDRSSAPPDRRRSARYPGTLRPCIHQWAECPDGASLRTGHDRYLGHDCSRLLLEAASLSRSRRRAEACVLFKSKVSLPGSHLPMRFALRKCCHRSSPNTRGSPAPASELDSTAHPHTCPHCGWHNVRRSTCNGVIDRLMFSLTGAAAVGAASFDSRFRGLCCSTGDRARDDEAGREASGSWTDLRARDHHRAANWRAV